MSDQTAKRNQAQKLYVHQQLSLAKISQETGIALGTLKDWSGRFDWAGKKEIQTELSELMPQLQLKLVKDIIASVDPQATAQLVNSLSGFKRSTEGAPVKETKKDDEKPAKKVTKAELEEQLKRIYGL